MSDLIRTARVRAGITGAELAERLGVTPSAVSQMELSERRGSIQLETMQRALAAMGRDMILDAAPSDPYAKFFPENVTNEINHALDDGQPEYALRVLTAAALELRRSPEKFSRESLSRRPSEIGDRRWEQLFRAVMRNATTANGLAPSWAQPQKLSRAWYPFGRYESLRARARTSTPEWLRELNIMLDERSLSRA